MDLLPEDVLADVLARLAPRALAVSRSVCRGWRAVADADARCQDQLRRAADLLPVTLGGVFVRTNEVENPTFFVRPSMAHRIAGDLNYGSFPWIADCCNGLILLDVVDLLVVNPATKQWAPLPPCPNPAALLPEHEQGTDDYYMFLAFDPTLSLSPHYEVLAMRGPPDRGETREWPPSVYVVRVYSSSTGRWEERPFVREREEEGRGPRTVADRWSSLERGPCHAAHWHGALYVYWTDFITR
jgi:hypothetical protein